eukprot:Nk52_evm29s158 gene=Nk52_evmTU29s158
MAGLPKNVNHLLLRSLDKGSVDEEVCGAVVDAISDNNALALPFLERLLSDCKHFKDSLAGSSSSETAASGSTNASSAITSSASTSATTPGSVGSSSSSRNAASMGVTGPGNGSGDIPSTPVVMSSDPSGAPILAREGSGKTAEAHQGGERSGVGGVANPNQLKEMEGSEKQQRQRASLVGGPSAAQFSSHQRESLGQIAITSGTGTRRSIVYSGIVGGGGLTQGDLVAGLSLTMGTSPSSASAGAVGGGDGGSGGGAGDHHQGTAAKSGGSMFFLSDKHMAVLVMYLERLMEVVADDSERCKAFTPWYSYMLYYLNSQNLATAKTLNEMLMLLMQKDSNLVNMALDFYFQNASPAYTSLLSGIGDMQVNHFLNKLNDFFVKPTYRLLALNLLISVGKQQGHFLHKIVNTNLFNSLLLCLKNDVNLITVSTACLALTMLLPHICASLTKKLLNTVFGIFCRLMMWEDTVAMYAKRAGTAQSIKITQDSLFSVEQNAWLVAEDKVTGHGKNVKASYEVNELLTKHLNNCSFMLFMHLYGMFPCNFFTFLRSKYLNPPQPNVNGEDVEYSHHRFEMKLHPYLSKVQLHPLLVTSSSDEEMNTARWRKQECHDTVAECTSLASRVEDLDYVLVNKSIRRFSNIWNPDVKQFEKLCDENESLSGVEHCAEAKSAVCEHIEEEDEDIVKGEKRNVHAPVSSLATSSPSAFVNLSTPISSPQHSRPSSPVSPATPRAASPRTSVVEEEGRQDVNFPNTSGYNTEEALSSISDFVVSQKNFYRDRRASFANQIQNIGKRFSSTGKPVSLRPTQESSSITSDSLQAILDLQLLLAKNLHTVGFQLMGKPSNSCPSSPGMGSSNTVVSPIGTAHSSRSGSLQSLNDSKLARPVETYEGEALFSKDVALLHRQILLLRNEVLFEQYLKEQLVQRVRRLHKEAVASVATESELQDMHNKLKMQTADYNRLQSAFVKQKVELMNIQDTHSKWEKELQSRLKKYKEDSKILCEENMSLKMENESQKISIETVSRDLEESKSNCFLIKSQLEDIRPRNDKLKSLESNIDNLVRDQLYWEQVQSRNVAEIADLKDTISETKKNNDLIVCSYEEELMFCRQTIKKQANKLEECYARIDQLEASLVTRDSSVKELKALIENIKSSSKAELLSVCDKYDSLKAVNMSLENRITDFYVERETLIRPRRITKDRSGISSSRKSSSPQVASPRPSSSRTSLAK